MRSAFPCNNSAFPSPPLLLILFLHVAQHAWAQARQTDSECIHIGEDAGAGRADPGGSHRGPKCFMAIHANFSDIWSIHDPQTIEPGADWLKSFIPSVTAASGAFGLLIAFGVSQVGSLFSADAWNNITFTAGEVKNPGARHPGITCRWHRRL